MIVAVVLLVGVLVGLAVARQASGPTPVWRSDPLPDDMAGQARANPERKALEALRGDQ